MEEIRRCNDLIYERCPKYALQYGPTIGDDGFRELMKERLQKIKGINPCLLYTSGISPVVRPCFCASPPGSDISGRLSGEAMFTFTLPELLQQLANGLTIGCLYALVAVSYTHLPLSALFWSADTRM